MTDKKEKIIPPGKCSRLKSAMMGGEGGGGIYTMEISEHQQSGLDLLFYRSSRHNLDSDEENVIYAS